MHADVNRPTAAGLQLAVTPRRIRHDPIRRPQAAQRPRQGQLRLTDPPRPHRPARRAREGRIAHVLKRTQRQPLLARQVNHPSRRGHRDRQRLLRQHVLAPRQRGLGHLVMQRQRRQVHYRVDLPGFQHLHVIRIDLGLHVVLEVAHVGMGRSQGVA